MDDVGSVYVLELEGKPRYVGFTRDTLPFRLCQLRAQKGTEAIYVWIQSLSDRYALTIRSLEACSKGESRTRVRFHVTEFLQQGFELFNGNCRKRIHRGTGNPIATVPVYIYVLKHPISGEVKYVGKTVDLSDRKKGHRALGRTRCDAWKRSLQKEGFWPVLEVIETVTIGENWALRERFWIDWYRKQGAFLTNLTDGGEGTEGRLITPEYREKLRQAFKGRPIPEEQRRQISKSLMGLKQSQETIAKRRATMNANRIMKGLPEVGEGREQSLQRRRERRWAAGSLVRGSQEWKDNLAQKAREQYERMTPEEREAFRARRRGQPSPNKGKKFGPQSEERRRLQSEKLKAYIASLTPEQRRQRTASAVEARRKGNGS